MGNRLSKIYTRTGDDGTTGLGDGSRVPKDSPRVEAYGTVDELNSALGVLLALPNLPRTLPRASPKSSRSCSTWAASCAFPVISPSRPSRSRASSARSMASMTLSRRSRSSSSRAAGRRRPPATSPGTVARRAERRVCTLAPCGERESRGREVPQSPLGPAVRDCAGAGAARARRRSSVASRSQQAGLTARPLSLIAPRGAP